MKTSTKMSSIVDENYLLDLGGRLVQIAINPALKFSDSRMRLPADLPLSASGSTVAPFSLIIGGRGDPYTVDNGRLVASLSTKGGRYLVGVPLECIYATKILEPTRLLRPEADK